MSATWLRNNLLILIWDATDYSCKNFDNQFYYYWRQNNSQTAKQNNSQSLVLSF